MDLRGRLQRLESRRVPDANKVSPYKQAQMDEIGEWIDSDPLASELMEKEFEYCKTKGYPAPDMDNIEFFMQLDDPVLDKMGDDILAAFDRYLRTRRAV